MDCNIEQKNFIDYLDKNIINDNITNLYPIFITGSAGSGKSYLLRCIIDKFKDYNINPDIAAFTAIVSKSIGGRTIHSLFKFDFFGKCLKPNVSLLKNMKVLIIDEISMVSAKYLDSINDMLMKYKKNTNVFGGVFVIVFGDLYQLEPISNDENDELPVYKSIVWQNFLKYQLYENMRQNEKEFINALNMIRIGKLDSLDYFNNIYKKSKSNNLEEKEINSTTIVSTNDEAYIINTRIFDKIKQNNSEIYYLNNANYKTKYINYDPDVYDYSYDKNNINKIFPNIYICKGTKIMITANCVENSCKNSDMGYIDNIVVDEDKNIKYIILNMIDGYKKYLYKSSITFRNKRKDKILSMNGFPITYAWAITCHKSQGSTIDNLIIKSNNTFAKGQLYVALSRVKLSDNLILLNSITEKDVLCNDEVNQLYSTMNNLII
ncbi:unknown similar to baculovirus helicase-2 [Choristoneura biennis entomopoxvirus]|uniref:DNA helicase Pif1-like DEAD-box helicase domain-containing protein n=1 Tax=Choristoneura biennis entomopoxvirus TaxID=10288 RepID=A0A916KQ73_CBEPV|nr:helicase [Choristoneura biennis entomopoxvirus]CCU55825.1 unknown similar to baculovirus helicase-2 [Choristoneura biennis entomopoxvirus]